MESTTNISNKDLLSRNSYDFLQAKLDGEMVLMHVDSAEYYGMDKMTTHIWELLEEDQSLDQVTQKLITEYEVDYDTCLSEIKPVIKDMVQKDMLRLSSSSH